MKTLLYKLKVDGKYLGNCDNTTKWQLTRMVKWEHPHKSEMCMRQVWLKAVGPHIWKNPSK